MALGVALSGCGTNPGPAPQATPAPAPDPACVDFQRYGDLSGRTVDIAETASAADTGSGVTSTATPAPVATPTPVAADQRIAAFSGFEACTGVRIRHRSVASIAESAATGQPPDLGYVPDAAALTELVRTTGAVKPAPPPVAANVAEFYPETYRAAGSVDGTLYAAPLDAEVKSLVWYSPRVFAARGYAVPTSWDGLLELSRRIVADGSIAWCADPDAAPVGPASGRQLVDSLEDSVLSSGGPELFDAWVEHRIPTDAPQVVAALDGLAPILRGATTGGNVAAGGPDPAGTPTSTPGPASSSPITSAGCLLARQGDSYAGDRPPGTVVAADGDLFAFRLPDRSPEIGATALVGGGFVIAFSDRREVQAVAAYLSTPDWANTMARESKRGWLSPSSGVDPAALKDPVGRLALGILQDPRVTLRYDGSDRMPTAVGAQGLPQALSAWSAGTPAAAALAAAEASWPPR